MSSKGSVFPLFLNDARKYIEFELFGIDSYASKFTYFMFGLLKKLFLSFGDYNSVYWLILSVFIWTVLHGIYIHCIKLLLQRVGVNGRDRHHLSETIWELCFTTVSVPIVLFAVGGNVGDLINLSGVWAQRLDYQLSKCKIHEDFELPGVKTLFVLHGSFLAHDMMTTWYAKGFKNLEFLQKQMFLATFGLTYYSKCPLLGLSLLFLLLRPALVALLSKLCCLFAHFTHSLTLTCLAHLLAASHLLLWSGTFFYNFPKFLLLGKTIDSGMMKAEIKMLIVFDIMLWFFIITTVVTSMFSRLMLSLVVPCKDRPLSLDHILFGSDPWLLKLTSSNKRLVIDLEIDGSENDEARKKIKARETLMQTIRCSIILKRKIRRMREEKVRRLQEKIESKSSEEEREKTNSLN